MFARIEETLTYVHDLITLKRGEIGLEYVAYADDTLIPKYPAAVVAPGETKTQVHGTHYFLRTFSLEILVMHARLSKSRAIRAKEDLEMTTRLINVLAVDPSCEQQCIFSFVPSEAPLNVADNKNQPVLGTHITWQAEARVPFN